MSNPIHAVKKATRFEALEPIRQAVKEHFGGFCAGAADGLNLRHDHGSVYMSDDSLAPSLPMTGVHEQQSSIHSHIP